ncbi:hypothetical protein F383_38684 [Gossypium arboreum]|uniref:Uncharacterized protein n=1 Tax=Gossypium arboreum TaxID=29729 RepID=A0A0B0MGU1_GOSAR|nr:hypothetical protein F383_38684 [Gossypium arboreum]
MKCYQVSVSDIPWKTTQMIFEF